MRADNDLAGHRHFREFHVGFVGNSRSLRDDSPGPVAELRITKEQIRCCPVLTIVPDDRVRSLQELQIRSGAEP